MHSSLRTGLMTMMAVALTSATAFANERFTASDIREDIIGKRIYLAVPLGGEFPLNYRKNGQVDGSGEALGLGRFAKPNDTGRWWIKGDRLASSLPAGTRARRCASSCSGSTTSS